MKVSIPIRAGVIADGVVTGGGGAQFLNAERLI